MIPRRPSLLLPLPVQYSNDRYSRDLILIIWVQITFYSSQFFTGIEREPNVIEVCQWRKYLSLFSFFFTLEIKIKLSLICYYYNFRLWIFRLGDSRNILT